MFSESKAIAKIAPAIRRVLIVDGNPHSARLMADLLKVMGAHSIVCEPNEKRAMASAKDLEPCMILTEHVGPGLDGAAFAKAVRRSHLTCRRVPIIMVTADATMQAIMAARDAGVHEFLRKPYTAADLMRRVENVALKPRDWIEGVAYVGPDRRRFNSAEYKGPAKRKSDQPRNAEANAFVARDQAVRILAAALDQFDNDPMQAMRAIREQATKLKDQAVGANDTQMAAAAGALEVSLASGATGKAAMTAPIQAILLIHPLEHMKKAG